MKLRSKNNYDLFLKKKKELFSQIASKPDQIEEFQKMVKETEEELKEKIKTEAN